MPATLRSAFRSFLYWLLGSWVIGAVFWTTWVVYLEFPWNPRASPLAQIGGMLLWTLIVSLPLALIGSFCMTLLREVVRRILSPGSQKVPMLIFSMALGYLAVALVMPDSLYLHVIGLIAAGCGELLVSVGLRAGHRGAA